MLKKPAVSSYWLMLISGLLWSGVGIFLLRIALQWILRFPPGTEILVLFSGVVLGAGAAVGFSFVVRKNIRRIRNYQGAVCVFAFQEWKSYLLVAVMMSLGIFLRTCNSIPRQLVAPVYVTIGLALFVNSFTYYRHFREMRWESRRI